MTAQVINLNKDNITLVTLRGVRSLRKEVVDKPVKTPEDFRSIAAFDTLIEQLTLNVIKAIAA